MKKFDDQYILDDNCQYLIIDIQGQLTVQWMLNDSKLETYYKTLTDMLTSIWNP